MKYVIDKEILQNYNLTLGEFLYLLLNIELDNSMLLLVDIKNSLIAKGLGSNNITAPNQLVLSNNTKDLISKIIVESEETVVSSSLDYNDVANAMRECYPQGKKAGTSYQWRDSTAVIATKLKTLVAKYDFKFTKEQAVEATKYYVKSFNGDYSYMQLLKYFILKTDKNKEIRSDFMSYIENAGQEDIEAKDNSWTSYLV